MELTPIRGGHLLITVHTAGATTGLFEPIAALAEALTHRSGGVVVDLWSLLSGDRRIADTLNAAREELAAHGRRLALVNVNEQLRDQLTEAFSL